MEVKEAKISQLVYLKTQKQEWIIIVVVYESVEFDRNAGAVHFGDSG